MASKSRNAKGKRRKALAAAKAAKKATMAARGGESRYARKRRYLDRNGGWGFQWGQSDGTGKPWRGAI